MEKSNTKRIHFVGIGGISVSALAMHSLRMGNEVSGSDLALSPILDLLKNLGAKIYLGHNRNNVLGADLVVATSAVTDNNPEILEAKKREIPILKRSEFLGAILKKYRKVVAVSGCHGKTTTTAMIAKILIDSDIDPTVFLGGECSPFGNFRFGKNDVAITEACEYKKNLLDIFADVSLILNIDNDHMDCYDDIEDMKKTYFKASERGIRIINADDKNSIDLNGTATLTFAINNPANYQAKRIKKTEKGYSFTIYAYSRRQERINLKIAGYHNVYNALAAYCVGDLLGVSPPKMKCALESFGGVKRRNEYLGKINDIDIIADYAHHPKEISAILKMHREDNKKFAVVFQPHTFSRTEMLMKDFVDVLSDVCELLIYKTYPARESFSEKGSALTLKKNLINAGNKKCAYVEDERDLIKRIVKLRGKVDKVLVLGAGDLYADIMRLIER